MHTLEKNRQEVVQGNQKGVSPLAGEVRREGGILLGGGDKWQDEPITPLGLTLQLRCLPLEKLLSLLQVSFLRDERNNFKRLFLFINKQFGLFRFSAGCYLDGVDDVVSVQAGSQFVDGGSVNVLQPAEQTSVQVKPVLLQTKQVKALDKLLQLINDLIHLQMEFV